MAEDATAQGRLASGQSLVFLYGDDLDRHARFYAEVLGFPQVLDQGDCRIFRISSTAFLGVCDRRDRPRGTAGVTVSFVVADVDAAFRALATRGVVFEGPPGPQAGGTVRSAFFRDPQGYRLEIQEFRDPHWAASGGP
jgi:catechol 2,3-dioxygenase-like lactoylglutathione lyase family enzyme